MNIAIFWKITISLYVKQLYYRRSIFHSYIGLPKGIIIVFLFELWMAFFGIPWFWIQHSDWTRREHLWSENGLSENGVVIYCSFENNMPAMASGTSKMYMFIGNMLNYDYDDELLDFPSTLLPNKPIWLEINNLFKRSHQCLMNMAVDPGTDPWWQTVSSWSSEETLIPWK